MSKLGNSSGVSQRKSIAMGGEGQQLACGGAVKSRALPSTPDALAANARGMAGEGYVPTSSDYKNSGASFAGNKKGGGR